MRRSTYDDIRRLHTHEPACQPHGFLMNIFAANPVFFGLLRHDVELRWLVLRTQNPSPRLLIVTLAHEHVLLQSPSSKS